MTRIEALARRDTIIYVAGRLFDLHEKLKSEELETAVLAGARDAAMNLGLTVDHRVTFVPFRDAGQEDLVESHKTRLLFELDRARLARTALLVTYIDGLAKDEGVCFEAGYAYVAGAALLLISTDFFEIELPNGHHVPFDPLLYHAATTIIRRPRLSDATGGFLASLHATRDALLDDVRTMVTSLILDEQQPAPRLDTRRENTTDVLIDFGGGVYEWQELLLQELERLLGPAPPLTITRTRRYHDQSLTPHEAGARDLNALERASLLITCTDADEAPSGTAFLQGAMCALGRPVWMYNSKRTGICGPGGYRSSRNLMLDYSATRVFRTLNELATALQAFAHDHHAASNHSENAPPPNER